MSEMFLDSINWKSEAEAVIKDVVEHVKTLVISDKCPSSDRSIYLNITTNEGNNFCVELSAQGFRVVGKHLDENSLDTEEYFETPYSLLNSISPSFRNSFASALQKKLSTLNPLNSDLTKNNSK